MANRRERTIAEKLTTEYTLSVEEAKVAVKHFSDFAQGMLNAEPADATVDSKVLVEYLQEAIEAVSYGIHEYEDMALVATRERHCEWADLEDSDDEEFEGALKRISEKKEAAANVGHYWIGDKEKESQWQKEYDDEYWTIMKRESQRKIGRAHV